MPASLVSKRLGDRRAHVGQRRLALRDLIAEILPLSELVRRINQKDLGDGTHVVGILG